VKYDKRFPIAICLCNIALAEAAQEIGPAFVYELRVSKQLACYARVTILFEMYQHARLNALTPFINLVVDETYDRDEWSLHANGHSIGSEGC
jgi:hypothetical protein